MSLVMELPKVRGEYRENFPLHKSNWFNVGGPAEILFKPADLEDLVDFLRKFPENDRDVSILGLGSNILIRDGGIDGVVIKLGRFFADIQFADNGDLLVGAACINRNLVTFCLENGLTGLEFLVGIPGSVGGGIAMNAGCYGSEFKDVIQSVKAVDRSGNIHILTNEDMGFIYRGHSRSEQLFFVEARFALSVASREEIKARVESITKKREESQPLREKTGGSSFRNPPEKYAWRLIDDAGLRGFRIGGAQISEKHCNFLINLEDATASDLESLGEYAREKVFLATGQLLEWEIKRIGKSRRENV
jgi:UDP-N-acetylmuramate dehydrogenase